MKISISSLVVSSVLLLSNAWAAPAPLPAGKPAGIKQAQREEGGTGMLAVAGAALIGITVGLATAGGDDVTATTTTVTSTTGTSP